MTPSPEPAPAPGPGDPACPHAERDDRGVCRACGHCVHDIVLNGACLHCGATDLDPVAMSPKPPALIPVDRLTRK
jgi:hypothetical protein